MTPEQAARFFSKTERDSKGCLIWTASKTSKGYGEFGHNGKTKRAHRVVWEHVHGTIPTGMHVCHKCDIPACVEVSHLFLGTGKDNTNDMIAKRRHSPPPHPRGEKANRAWLTDDQAWAIRSIHAGGGVKQCELAVGFGCCQGTISQILLRKTRTDAGAQ
jgi:hypothetical protein